LEGEDVLAVTRAAAASPRARAALEGGAAAVVRGAPLAGGEPPIDGALNA
jgi:hypothetical protein